MKIKFAELHAPLFHGGKNHGMKLKAGGDLEMDYDRAEKELTVTYKGESTYVPSTSVQNYTPLVQEDLGLTLEKAVGASNLSPLQLAEHANKLDPNISHPKDVRKIKSAQVSGPHDHVFQGEGAGRKRDK